jgi:thioredoxin-dependent peroxiredoxin
MAQVELKPGDTAPDFETVDDKNQKVKLSDYRGKKVVLYFYPQDDTRGCTIQACGFRDIYPQVEEKGAVVLGVSRDDVESHQAFRDKNQLPFPLLVDKDHKIHDLYGAWGERKRPDSDEVFMGVLRSHFVIDEEGKVKDAQYRVAPEASPELSIKEL